MGGHYNEEDRIVERAQTMPVSHARAILHKHATGGYKMSLKMDRVLVKTAERVLGPVETKKILSKARKYKPDPVLQHRVPGSFGCGKRR
jgi:hypothetical protein